jgi:hypothetical protein
MNTATISYNESYLSKRNASDWGFALLVVLGAAYAFWRYSVSMDIYEKWILAGAVPSAIWLGWFWRPLRPLMLTVAFFALLAIGSYQRDLGRAENVFWLKYFLSSQSAILWMCVLTLMSTVFYWVGVLKQSHAATWSSLGTKLAWGAVTMALIATMVRWHESHLLGPDIGHIPVSNLYEVFVLFVWMTTLFYLYFEAHYKDQQHIRSLGAFVMLVISAAVGFIVWYSLDRGAHEIQPLVPALKSWDEAARARQLCGLWHLLLGGDGGICVFAQVQRGTAKQAALGRVVVWRLRAVYAFPRACGATRQNHHD